jgi:hypothetical protein
MIGDLAVQGSPDHPLDQLLQRPTFAGQLQARCAGLLDEPKRPVPRPRRQQVVLPRTAAVIHGGRLRHQVLAP